MSRPVIRNWWLRPWLWGALRARRKAVRLDATDRERRARQRAYGCDCGRVVQGSPSARGLRAFRVCPALGCSRQVSRTTVA
jgi:hypothetical protein